MQDTSFNQPPPGLLVLELFEMESPIVSRFAASLSWNEIRETLQKSDRETLHTHWEEIKAIYASPAF